MKTALQKNELKLVSVIPWGNEATVETKLDHLDRVARECGEISIKAALMAGWLLTIENAARQGTFVAWMNNNLHMSQKTAYRYMGLFEHTASIQGGSGFKLECSDKSREEMVNEFASNVESKSLSELYVEAGIVKPTKSNLGGRREGAGRKRKLTEEQMAAQAAEIATDPVIAYDEISIALDKVEAFVIARDGLGLLDKLHIEFVLHRLHSFCQRGEEILNARASKVIKEVKK